MKVREPEIDLGKFQHDIDKFRELVIRDWLDPVFKSLTVEDRTELCKNIYALVGELDNLLQRMDDLAPLS